MADAKPSRTHLDRLIGWVRAVRHAASTRRLAEAQEGELRELRHALDHVERLLRSQGNSNAETEAKLELVRREFAYVTPHLDQALSLRTPVEALDAAVKRLTALQEQLIASQHGLHETQANFAAEILRLAPRFPRLSLAGSDDSATWFDAAFQETFRGSREQVRQRLAVYVPEVREAHSATGQLAVLDVGCGRGEWLELLRAENIAARGVDQNAFIVNQCRGRGLDVRQGDAMEFLTHEPEQTLAAVTAFHLVEHLRLAEQLQLMVAASRALAPGGVLILETPNPENLVVGSWTFYTDPSHQRPLPPTLLRFLLEAIGFEVVDIRRLHVDDELAERAMQEGWPSGLRDLICGPRDFGVIARRPGR